MQKILARQALTPTGWAKDVCVTLDQGRFVAVDADATGKAKPVDLLLPAPVNLHSHAFQRAMAGLTETRGPDPRDSFWTWRRLMYRFLDRLTPEQVEAIAAQVFMEMFEAGYGAVAEFHYLHHDVGGTPYTNLAEMAERIVAAAQTTGIGLTLLPVLYMEGGCDGRPLDGGQRRFGNDLERYVDLHAASSRALERGNWDHRMGYAAHSLRAVPPDALTRLMKFAAGGPVHRHLAEQVAEVEEVEAHLGARPVEWVIDNLPLDPRWCLIHCTQMLPEETLGLAGTGAVAGLCPIPESSLGAGIFDGVRYLNARGRFGVGSDSNIRISFSEELRTLEYSQRLRDKSRAAVATPKRSTGRILFDGVVCGGAQAVGRNAGRIADGCFADLLALDAKAIDLEGRNGDEILDAYIFAGDDRMVCDVWSAGRHVVRGGNHVKGDAIRQAYRATMKRLRNRL